MKARAEVRYRVDDLDRGDRAARLEYDLVRTPAGWRVEAERPVGAGATAPWVAMPRLRVRRGEHGVVAGTVPTRTAERARGRSSTATLPALGAQWKRTPARVLVLAPATGVEADALLGRPAGSDRSPVAATTEGPTGADGTATGDRVVLDPTAFDRLTRSGRDVVLTHELAHVAVRATVPGHPAGWLAEGYADHVGYRRADVSTRAAPRPARSPPSGPVGRPRRCRARRSSSPAAATSRCPTSPRGRPSSCVAERHGEAALRRLVAAGSSTGSDADAEATTDRALVSELGTTRAELTRQWLARLGRLGATG